MPGWDLIGEKPVGFDWVLFDGPLIGDELIKIEHVFNGVSFPGRGYALLSNIYANDEQDVFIKSYPKKTGSRIYEIKVPEPLKVANYELHHLMVKHNLYAQVDADADWKIRAYVWLSGTGGGSLEG